MERGPRRGLGSARGSPESKPSEGRGGARRGAAKGASQALRCPSPEALSRPRAGAAPGRGRPGREARARAPPGRGGAGRRPLPPRGPPLPHLFAAPFGRKAGRAAGIPCTCTPLRPLPVLAQILLLRGRGGNGGRGPSRRKYPAQCLAVTRGHTPSPEGRARGANGWREGGGRNVGCWELVLALVVRWRTGAP